MLAAADELIVQLWSDDTKEDILRRRNRVSYYLEAAQLAMREAITADARSPVLYRRPDMRSSYVASSWRSARS